MQLNKLPAAAGAGESLELPPWLASIPQLPPEQPSRTPAPSHPHFYGGFLVFLNWKVLKHPKLQPSERLDAFSPPFLGGSFLIRDSLQGWLPGPGAALASSALSPPGYFSPAPRPSLLPGRQAPPSAPPHQGVKTEVCRARGGERFFYASWGSHLPVNAIAVFPDPTGF